MELWYVMIEYVFALHRVSDKFKNMLHYGIVRLRLCWFGDCGNGSSAALSRGDGHHVGRYRVMFNVSD